jgi:5-methyltetrahydrofolate--homocysteine methyltransferase
VRIDQPSFLGRRTLSDFSLTRLREFIDWSPFFHTWELRGVYPAILNHEKYGEQARKLFADANALLDRVVEEKLLTAKGVYGLFPANRQGDDVELFTDGTRMRELARLYFLRQQVGKDDGQPYRCLADFVAPKHARAAKLPGEAKSVPAADHVGAFAVTAGIGLDELVKKFKADHDDYNAIMIEAVGDRLAEAFAEYLHAKVRKEWGYARDERLSNQDLIDEKYRGIRPAPGYPACPDHTEKRTIWRLLDVEKNTGMKLTESCAMWPASSVSGLYFAHPDSRYFAVGRLGLDQVEDYARRKGMSLTEAERWLGPWLNYTPGS